MKGFSPTEPNSTGRRIAAESFGSNRVTKKSRRRPSLFRPTIRRSQNLKELYAKYADAGLAVLEHNISERAPAADAKYKSRSEPGYPIFSRRLSADAKKDYVDFAKFYRLNAAGQAILIDVDGKVVSVRPNADDLEKLLKERFPNVK